MFDSERTTTDATRRAKRLLEEILETVLHGQPIGECPDCGTRFEYSLPTTEASDLIPCPNCGSNRWYKWGYRHDGAEVRRDYAWDRYDAPPPINRDSLSCV